MYDTVGENLLRIRKEIEPCKPRIIAITKYFPQEAVEKAYKAGLRDFGESRAIEACEKIENLPDEIRQNSTFHFIGHLQTNKVKHVIKVFEFIHSVDSFKLAQSISTHAQEIGKVQKILLQVNNAEEEQKFGFSKKEVFENYRINQPVYARVAQIMEDGRLTLSVKKKIPEQMKDDAEFILTRLKLADGFLPYHDKSDPAKIKETFHLSKNAFKRAIGRLMKEGKITIASDGIRLVK